jgi:hypothetical protein
LLGPSSMLSGVMSFAGGDIGNLSALDGRVRADAGADADADAADVEVAKYEDSKGSCPGAWSMAGSLFGTGSQRSCVIPLACSVPLSPCVEVGSKMWVVERSGTSAESDGCRRI